MKVWIGYHFYFNSCEYLETAVKVFDDEVKALIWKEDFEETEWDSRGYRAFELE